MQPFIGMIRARPRTLLVGLALAVGVAGFVGPIQAASAQISTCTTAPAGDEAKCIAEQSAAQVQDTGFSIMYVVIPVILLLALAWAGFALVKRKANISGR